MSEALLSVGLRQACLLAMAVAVLRIARPWLLRQGATVAYAAWWLVPVLMLTPALPGSPATHAWHVAARLEAVAGTPWLSSVPAAHPVPHAPWLRMSLWTWLAGTLAVLGVHAVRQGRLARWPDRLPAGSSPMLVGVLRPRIALPVDFEERFTPLERELVLAHEAVHRRRGDNAWNLLAALLVALHWWNPLAWWAARRMRGDQELACDEAVLASRAGCRPAYVAALLAAHDVDVSLAPATSRWSSPHPLVERIAMLNHPSCPTRRRGVVLGLLLAAVAGLAWASQAPVAPAPAGPSLRFDLVIAQQVGDRVNRLGVALVGRPGERLKLDNPGDGTDAYPPLSLELVAQAPAGGKVRVDAVLEEGRPLVVTSRPTLILAMQQPGMVEHLEPGTNRRTTLVIVPTLFEGR